MKSTATRFQDAIVRFDQLNAEDPNSVHDGKEAWPKELLYAERMTGSLLSFDPEASEVLLLAARCQHIQRWKIPRSDYAQGKMGYKRWRNELKRFHASKAAEVLEEVGYDANTISRVQALIKKKGLKSDPEVQTLEDVICLVFLQFYAVEFAGKHDEEKVVEIIRKTWKKMSPAGHKAALSLDLPDGLKSLIERALAPA